MRLSRLLLRVTDANRLAAFYQARLGMRHITETVDRSDGESRHLLIGYEQADRLQPHSQAQLDFLECPQPSAHAITPYQPSAADVYWKIGITLNHVKRAQDRLMSAGVDVSEPQQFRDIGFLCHLHDPEGFEIELLQHDFETHHVAAPENPDHPLGGQATLGQITLRVVDIDANLKFYRDALGMKLLSIQPVEPYRFTLYFLAFTSDVPPNPDLEAIDNREWLWKRPYTTLELQHLWSRTQDEPPLHIQKFPQPGFAGLGISCRDLGAVSSQLVDHGVTVQLSSNERAITVYDPQGTPVSIYLEGHTEV